MSQIDLDAVLKKSKGLGLAKKFREEMKNTKDMIKRIKRSKDKRLNEILSNYVIIRLVTIFEYHFKSLVMELVDSDNFDYHDEIKISFPDLKMIQKNSNITVGKIIATTKNFQNFETVIKIMNDLLNKQFLKELKMMYQHEVQVKVIQECLDKRHKIIHGMEYVPVNVSKLEKYDYAMFMFMINSSLYLGLEVKAKEH